MATKVRKNTPSSKTRKKISMRYGIMALVLVMLLVFASMVVVSFQSHDLRVGFYDVDPQLEASMTAIVDEWAKREKASVRIVHLPVVSLDAKSLRGVDAVFLYPSMPNKASCERFSDIAAETANEIALPLLQSVSVADRQWALPVLVDTDEIMWEKTFLPVNFSGQTLRLSVMDSWYKKGVNSSPSVIAGADDMRLLDFVGSLVLDSGGGKAYETLCTAVASKDANVSSVLDTDLDGTTLRVSLECLFRYTQNGVLHPNWLDFKSDDMIATVNASLVGIAVQNLSTHRKEARETLSGWASVPLSFNEGSGLPSVAASVLCFARPGSGRASEVFGSLSAFLISSEGQKTLQRLTGLAPASASAQSLDIQATEARAAVSGAKVRQGFSRDGFISSKSRTEFAAALRQYLRSR